MSRGQSRRLLVFLVVGVAFYGCSFPMNHWFAASMPRHQILQLPAMLLMGMALGLVSPRLMLKEHWGIAALILIAAALIFWMLPHSIDYAVVNEAFNRGMHVTMLACGVLWIAAFRGIIFEIKILFLGMLSAMLLATGVLLRTFDILLCSSFDIAQQRQTGLYLLLIGTALFMAALVTLLGVRPSRKKPSAGEGDDCEQKEKLPPIS